MKRKGRILALLMAAAMVVSALCAAAEPLAFEADAGAEAELDLPQDGAVETIDEQGDEANAEEEGAAPDAPSDSDALAAAGFLMDGDTLVVYEGEGGDVIVPDGVRVIGPVAFCELPELRSVEIPASVERLGELREFGGGAPLRRIAGDRGLRLRELRLPEGHRAANELDAHRRSRLPREYRECIGAAGRGGGI